MISENQEEKLATPIGQPLIPLRHNSLQEITPGDYDPRKGFKNPNWALSRWCDAIKILICLIKKVNCLISTTNDQRIKPPKKNFSKYSWVFLPFLGGNPDNIDKLYIIIIIWIFVSMRHDLCLIRAQRPDHLDGGPLIRRLRLLI